MTQHLKDLLQLYENTIASQGFARREAHDGTQRSAEDRFGHARWMIDQIQQNAVKDNWPETRIQREIGMIQGILWSENQFSLRAIEDQSLALDPDYVATALPKPMPQPATAPVAMPPSIVSGEELDNDEEDVAFAAGIGATPVAMPVEPASTAVPVKLPE